MNLIKLLPILLLLLVFCKKDYEDVDLGVVKDFDIKAGWPDIAIITLDNGKKFSLPGVSRVTTGMHLHCHKYENKKEYFNLEVQ